MLYILSIGNDPEVLTRRSTVLAGAGYAIISVTNLPKAAEKIANEEFDLVVLCNSLGAEDRRQLTNMTLRHRPFTPVVNVPQNAENDQLVLNAVENAVSGRAGTPVA